MPETAISLLRRRETVDSRETLSPARIALLIQRERARSDRVGRPFSLVLFAPASTAAAHVAIEQIQHQARLIDDAGWYDAKRPCALLPETDATGAQTFAARACAAVAARGVELRYEAFTYPSRWFGGPPDGTEPGDDHRDGNGSVHNHGRQHATPARPVHAVSTEAWFAKPLPRWKRCLDIAGASLGLLLLSPVMLAAALAIRLTSPGPAIFRQERAALGGRPFRMYKFRTMVAGAEQQQELLLPLNEQDGPAFKLSDDPRITPVGRWLRKTSIDELPQLLNVLKGDMSLVGPRPLPVHESDQCQQWHRARLDVTPGLTCIWQVNGRCNTNFDRWVRMDIDYVRRRSLWFDLLLIVRTVPAVLLQRGAK